MRLFSRLPRNLRHELVLAVLPTATILIVLAGVEVFIHQRLLFASLASSAFLIYMAPHHRSNRVRVLFGSQIGAALCGYGIGKLWAPGYLAAACALVIVIFVMIALDAVHPPAVSTALSFAFVPSRFFSVILFAAAMALIVLLLLAQRSLRHYLPYMESGYFSWGEESSPQEKP